MTKIIDLQERMGVLTPSKVIQKLTDYDLENVVVVATTEEGDNIIAHSPLTLPELVYMLEDTKLILMTEDSDG